jgi:hypothetical protein
MGIKWDARLHLNYHEKYIRQRYLDKYNWNTYDKFKYY